jgi:hypothetical protein
MGFAGKSGASATALGSVRQYGLIEGVGDNTRVTDLALRILEPVSPAERSEAVLEAAKKPEVFQAIFERFEGRIPAADEPVRAFLIREMGFSKRGVEECIASLRATLEVVQEITARDGGSTSSPVEAQASLHSHGELATHASVSPPSELMRIPLTRECSVELRFVGPVTEKAITNLIRHVELTREVWGEG